MEHVGDLRGEVCGLGRAPLLRRPALARGFGPALLDVQSLARQVAEVVAAAHRVEQVRGEQRVVRHALDFDADRGEQRDGALQVVD